MGSAVETIIQDNKIGMQRPPTTAVKHTFSMKHLDEKHFKQAESLSQIKYITPNSTRNQFKSPMRFEIKEQETPKIKYSMEITRPVSSVSYNTIGSSQQPKTQPKSAANKLMLTRKMSTGSLSKPMHQKSNYF
jgi:uncharacterized protein YpmS